MIFKRNLLKEFDNNAINCVAFTLLKNLIFSRMFSIIIYRNHAMIFSNRFSSIVLFEINVIEIIVTNLL